MARTAIESEKQIGAASLTKEFVINEAISVISETFRERQQGKLIAKLIATTRFPRMGNVHNERNRTIKQLASQENIFSRKVTLFIGRMDENPMADQRPVVRSLLDNQRKGGV